MTQKLTVAVAGTTTRTLQCLEALYDDPRFEVTWVLTPEPKPIGRKQVVTQNPVHQFALKHSITPYLVQKKITAQLTDAIKQVAQTHPIDFLLVVDFGYFVPNWLLNLPTKAPVNIHPSALPSWRGSSPGQFSLLYGDQTSAVTLMEMSETFDAGPIIAALPFPVQPSWTTSDYYAHSFFLIAPQLPDLLASYAQHPQSTPQPVASPTPTARKLTKEDAFISWEVLETAQHGVELPQTITLSELLTDALPHHAALCNLLEAATRAFQPWPGLWTLVSTTQGQKRMKILETHCSNGRLVLDTVHLEGKTPTRYTKELLK